MKIMTLKPIPFSLDQIPKRLEEGKIMINHYAQEYFSHPGFTSEQGEELDLVIASLTEIGLENGATLNEIARHIARFHWKSCPVNTGLFLRLAWKDQTRSSDSILSGTHEAPDQAVMVFSEMLGQDDSFPKGLYLRNVDGNLWLRGYICDSTYRFPGEALFAFVVQK